MADESPDRSRKQPIPLYALLTANAISRLGSQLTFVAIPWFVLITTGSAAKTGITLAADALPILVAGIFGGALVDRLGYKQSSVLSDLVSALSVAAIPLLYHTIGLAFWELLLLVFVGGLLTTPGATARDSLLPNLAELAGMPLERINSIAQAVPRTTLLIGPPLAGILIAIFGASNVLFLDTASFAISAVIVGLALPRFGKAALGGGRSYLAETLDGLRFIKRDRILVWIVATFAIGSLISEPIYVVVFPVFAKQVYGRALDLGLMYSALAVGSLIGLAYYAVFGPRVSKRFTLVCSFTVRALSFWVLVFLPPLPWVFGAIVVNAIFFEPINPLTSVILQTRVPEGLRGRVFGTFDAISFGTVPLGTLLGGFLLAGGGLVNTLIVIAAASLLQSLTLPLIPSLRALDSIPLQAAEEPAATVSTS